MWWSTGSNPEEDPPPPSAPSPSKKVDDLKGQFQQQTEISQLKEMLTTNQPSPSPPQEMDELKDQFEHQQIQLAQLKEMLTKNQQQLVTKEKEVESYATMLSGIKTRTRSTKRSPKQEAVVQQGTSQQDVVETSEQKTPEKVVEGKGKGTPGKSMEKARQGNLILLRKKLEETRVKYKQHGEEMTANKRGIEEMVEQLKMQLDERDHTIQDLQKSLEAHPREPNQENVDNSVCTQTEEDEGPDLVLAVALKDARITELEAAVLDLQENVREKDSVIDARTRAITLMSEDLSRKGKTTLDTLDETREQMRLMQHNFVTMETRMRGEAERLLGELETRDKRLVHLEECNRRLEATRFDLSTRNAELQEKVVRAQENASRLQQENTELQAGPQVAENLTRSLDEANKQLIKVKAQGKNKVKQLTKQLDNLKKVSDANEEIARLQNKVAELEEDKVSESRWQQQVDELGAKVRQHSQDLDSHVHMISLLEAEKLQHLQDARDQRLLVTTLEAKLGELMEQASELENVKVSAELKAVDLEEQVDVLTREKTELREEMEEASRSQGKPGPAEEEPEVAKKNEKDATNLELALKSLEMELADTKQTIDGQKEIIAELSMKLESREEELELQREMIAKLEQLDRTEEDGERLSEIVKDLNEMAADLDEWKNRCSQVEDRLRDLEGEKAQLEGHLQQVCVDNASLDTQLGEQRSLTANLTEKLRAQVQEIVARDEQITTIRNLITENGLALEEKERAAREAFETFKVKQIELEEEVMDKALVVQSLTVECKRCTEESERLKEEVTKKVEYIGKLELAFKDMQEVESRLAVGEDELKATRQELKLAHDQVGVLTSQNKDRTEKAKKLTANLKAKALALRGFEDKVKQYDTIIATKEATIAELTMAKEHYDTIVATKEANIAELTRDKEEFDIIVTAKEATIAELTMAKEHYDTILATKEATIVELTMAKEHYDTIVATSEANIAELTRDKEEFDIIVTAKEATIAELTMAKEQYDTIIAAKEATIAELTTDKEQLDTIVTAKEATIVELTIELQKSAEVKTLDLDLTTRIAEDQQWSEDHLRLTAETERLQGRNVVLEQELAALSESRLTEASLTEESRVMLLRRVSELEREIGVMQIELRNKRDELELMAEERARLNEEDEEERQRNVDLEMNAQELKAALRERDDALLVADQRAQQLERDVVGRDLRILELEDQAEAKHRGQSLEQEVAQDRLLLVEKQAGMWAAAEAKHREREAVVESLEQDLAHARDRVQALENNLAFVEERRQSLADQAEALGEKLQESDREKEDIVETEGLLEQRLATLVASEGTLRQRVDDLNRLNLDLEERLNQLSQENSALKKGLEMETRGFHKEVNRLEQLETSYLQASEKIVSLEVELKRSGAAMREQEVEARRRTECLEGELLSANRELERLETERRAVLERCERLGDDKAVLEEEVEGLVDALGDCRTTISNLQANIGERSEDLQNLRAELAALKTSTAEEGDRARREVEHLQAVLAERNQRIQQLEVVKGQGAAEEKQIEELKEVLALRESEVQTYQTRLLQLQFGGGVSATQQHQEAVNSKVAHLEEANVKLQKSLAEKEGEAARMNNVLAENCEQVEGMRSQLETHRENVERLEQEMRHLQDLARSREEQLRERIEKKSHELLLGSLRAEFASKLSGLEQEKNDIYAQLLREKAKSEITEIISLAEEKIDNVTACIEQEDNMAITLPIVEESTAALMGKEDSVQFANVAVKPSLEFPLVRFGDSAQEQVSSCHFFDMFSPGNEIVDGSSGAVTGEDDTKRLAEQVKELQERLGTLERELRAVRNERDAAVAQLAEMKLQDAVDTRVPIVEEVCMQKSAFLMYDKDKKPTADVGSLGIEETTATEDEGWGWGSDEARLEEEHLQQKRQDESVELVDTLKATVVTLENQIEDLQAERVKLSEDLKASQVRSGKMLKKLKDLKLKNDGLEAAKKSTGGSFGDLDSAIEEELKIRIEGLEKEVRDLKTERESAKQEKEGLARRVDVLTGANERFVEMKERQDVDVEHWKTRSKELANQIQALEWRIEELSEEKVHLETRASEEEKVPASNTLNDLLEQLAALTQDNENLQSLLEEQHKLRLAAVHELEPKVAETESDETLMRLLRIENDDLTLRLEAVQRELAFNTPSAGEVEALKSEKERLTGEMNRLQNVYYELKMEQEYTRAQFGEQLAAARQENETYGAMMESYGKRLENAVREKRDLEERHDTAEREHYTLAELFREVTAELRDVQEKFAALQLEHTKALQDADSQAEYNKISQELIEEDVRKESAANVTATFQTFTMANPFDNTSSLQNQVTDLEAKVTVLSEELRRKSVEAESYIQAAENLKGEYSELEQQLKGSIEKLSEELKATSQSLQSEKHANERAIKELNEQLLQIDSARKQEIEDVVNEKKVLIEDFAMQSKKRQEEFNELSRVAEQEVENLKDRLRQSEHERDRLKNRENLHEFEEKMRFQAAEREHESRKNRKDRDIDILRSQLSERDREAEEQMFQKDEELRNLQVQLLDCHRRMEHDAHVQISERDARIHELSQTLDEEAKQLTELRELVERREAELANTLERLTAMDSECRELKTRLTGGGDQGMSGAEEAPTVEARGAFEPHGKEQTELDLALYMLHQRDVRCDELTLELMQLLEERDTLQLRLSNAIRINEELRRAATVEPATSTPIRTVVLNPSARSSSDNMSTTQLFVPIEPQSITQPHRGEPTEDLKALANKLSQLHSVGYRHDVTLRDEREQRHNEQMQLLQRGAGIVVDANYTLSRDVQSPSTVLLNWIWGRSTPRVMHV